MRNIVNLRKSKILLASTIFLSIFYLRQKVIEKVQQIQVRGEKKRKEKSENSQERNKMLEIITI